MALLHPDCQKTTPDGINGQHNLRYRLSYADVAELPAERGVRVDPSTVYDWVREFAPLYEEAARPFRRSVGSTWSVDETCTKIAGKSAYVYRAIDGQGQVVDVYVSQRRTTADAAACLRRAIEVTGVVPDEVMTDGAAAYPPALAMALPPALHETGKLVQQRIERDHQHLKGRLRSTRGFKTLAGARVLCRRHAFLRNLRGGCYDLGRLVNATGLVPQPPVVQAWAAITGLLLGRSRSHHHTRPATPTPTHCAAQPSPHNPTEPSRGRGRVLRSARSCARVPDPGRPPPYLREGCMTLHG